MIRHRFIVPTAFIGCTQKTNLTCLVNQEEIFHRMLLMFAAVMEALFIRITRSVYRSVGAVVEKRDGPSAAARRGSAGPIVAARVGKAPCRSNA